MLVLIINKFYYAHINLYEGGGMNNYGCIPNLFLRRALCALVLIDERELDGDITIIIVIILIVIILIILLLLLPLLLLLLLL